MLRYTVFFWLVGLRNNEILLLAASAVVSVVLSYFLLRSQRDRFSEQIADRLERRHAARRQAAGTGEWAESDEAAEDPAVAAGDASDPRTSGF